MGHILKIVFLMVLIFTNQGIAKYSKPYNKEMSDLTVMEPEKSLDIARENLRQSQVIGDVEQQLISIYYILESLTVLSKTQEVDAYINIGLALAKKHHNIRFESEFLSFQSYQQELKGKYHEAVITTNRALQLAQEVDDDRLRAQQLAARGQVQMATENYDLAMKDVEAAIAVFKKHDDKENLSLNYNLLAIIYYSMNDMDNALKYYKESQNYDEIKSPYNLVTTYYNIASVYVSKEDYEQALDYYKKSSVLSKQINDKTSLAFTNYGIAEVYMLQKKVKEAEKILKPTIDIFKETEDELMLFNANLLMAELKTSAQQFPEALAYLDLAEVQKNSMDIPSANLYYLYQKIEYFVAQKLWKEAYDLSKLVSKAKKKLQDGDREKLISELKVRFNAQFDQEKLQLLTNQNKLQQAAIIQEQTRQKYLWGLVILGFMIFIITYIAYVHQRKIKKHMYQLSITDHLTKVSNRRHIVQQLKDYHRQSLSDNISFGLVMIDLDYFKNINDNYGHDVGNEALKYFATTVKTVIGDSGKIGRIGGEEWLLLFPNVSIEEIRKYLNEIRETYRSSLSLKIPKDCVLSFSSGVIMCSGQYENHEKMLSDVDNAMYAAKQKGREQDVFLMAS